MVRKLKQLAESKDDNQLAKAVRDSAQQIWLAGLGAFAKARDERTKVFEALAREGKSIQLRTRALAEERIGDVAGKVSGVTQMVGKQASESWDRLEQVFENRVSRALGRLGVPSSQDIEQLLARVDALTSAVEALGGKVPAVKPKRAAAKKKAAPAKREKPAAKAATKAAPQPRARKAGAKAEKAGTAPKAAKAPRKAAARPARAAAATAPADEGTVA